MSVFDDNGDLNEDFLDWWEEYSIGELREQYEREEAERRDDPVGYQKRLDEYGKGFANGYLFESMAPDLHLDLKNDKNNPYVEGFDKGRFERSSDGRPYSSLTGMVTNFIEVARLLIVERNDEEALEELRALEKEKGANDYQKGYDRGSFIAKYIPEYVEVILEKKFGTLYDFGMGLKDGFKSQEKIPQEKPEGFLLGMADKYLPSWLKPEVVSKETKDGSLDIELGLSPYNKHMEQKKLYNEHQDVNEGFLNWWENHLIEKYAKQLPENLKDRKNDREKDMDEFRRGYTNGYILSALAPELTLRLDKYDGTLHAYGFERGQIDKVFNHAPNNRAMTAEERLEVARLLTDKTGTTKELEMLNKVNGGYNYDTGFTSGFLVSKYIPDVLKEILKQLNDSPYEKGLKDGFKGQEKNTQEKSEGFLLGIADKYLPSWLRLDTPEKSPDTHTKGKEIDTDREPDI